MGDIRIKDGTSGSKTAQVTNNNRLAVAAVTQTLVELATELGDTYNVATNRVTLTDTAESAIFYLENQEDNDLIIDTIFINTTASTGTLSGQPTLRIYRNPSSGTIVTPTPTNAVITNRNYGSNKALVANAYEGLQGETLTGQTNILDVPLPTRVAVSFVEFAIVVVLPKGAAIGISYEPQTGSTSVDVIIGCTLTKNGTQL